MTQSLSSSEVESKAVVALEERLSAHPGLLERIEALLNVVENSAGDTEQADLAEQRVMEEVRQLARSLGVLKDTPSDKETSPGSLVKLVNKHSLVGQKVKIKNKWSYCARNSLSSENTSKKTLLVQ